MGDFGVRCRFPEPGKPDCAGLGVRRAVLVYPGRRDRVRTYALLLAPVRVEVCTLRVTNTPVRSLRSLRLLARRLRATPL